MRRRPLAVLALGLILALAATTRAAGPAEALFRLVPPDAGLTLAIEDLRGHARQFLDSALADGLRQLPAVRAWFASDRFRGFQRAQAEIEKALGENLARIRDDLLGDAVVLTVHLPPGGRQEDARGLLLVRVRDRALLDRLVQEVNAAQKNKGELERVTEHARGASVYYARELRNRPAEYFATFDDNTFAWSNSEALVQGVIDRKTGDRPGLGDEAPFLRVRRRLPERSAVSLFVNPRFLATVLASAPKSSKPADARIAALLGRQVQAMDYLGAAIEWRDGVILHVEEALDPKKLDPWLRNWAAQTSSNPLAHALPSAALAVATAHVDFPAVLDVVRALMPESERPRLDNLLLALNGLLLGNDPTALLAYPHAGPGLLAYVEPPGAPDARPFLPVVFVVNLGEDQDPVAGAEPAAAAPLDNALRTLLALRALDVKQGEPLRVETREVGGRKVTMLSGSSPFAYAIASGRLVLGNSAEAVARAFTQPLRSNSGFTRLQATYFPKVESFACVDLEAVYQLADAHRPWLVRRIAAKHQQPEADAARDLDQALALVHLFRSAFLTSAIAPDATSIHRSLGLIAKP
jgi:hypothetical protein